MNNYKIHTALYTIVACKPVHHARHNLLLSLIHKSNHTLSASACIPFPKAREITNSILGYNSKSITEICKVFSEWCINKDYLHITQYTSKNNTNKGDFKSSWTIL